MKGHVGPFRTVPTTKVGAVSVSEPSQGVGKVYEKLHTTSKIRDMGFEPGR